MADYAGGGVYGAGPAGGSQFNPLEFIRRPDSILRLLGWLFSVIVFGCIASQGVSPHGIGIYGNITCVYNNNEGACGYGTFVGVTAFLGLMAFIILSAMFQNINNAEHRKHIIMADIAFSGVWSFFWFICFCVLTNQWNARTETVNKSGAEAAIAFSFFSIIVFVILTVLAVRTYRLGLQEGFQPNYDADIYGDQGAASAPYAGTTPDAYQPFPASESKPVPPDAGYQAQSY